MADVLNTMFDRSGLSLSARSSPMPLGCVVEVPRVPEFVVDRGVDRNTRNASQLLQKHRHCRNPRWAVDLGQQVAHRSTVLSNVLPAVTANTLRNIEKMNTVLLNNVLEVHRQGVEQRLKFNVLLKRLPNGCRRGLLESGNVTLQLPEISVDNI